MNSASPADSAPRAAEPSANGNKWHDARGRFAKGNPGGPGNPFARRTALYQKAIRQVVSLEDMREVMTMVKLKAKSGDLAAVKILTAHTAGKGVPAVDPDRLDINEWQLTVEEAVDARDMKAIMTRLPVECAIEIVRAALPVPGPEMMDKLGYVLRIADPKEARRWIKKQRHKAERAQREAERARGRAERSQQQAAENAGPSTNGETERAESRQRPEPPQRPECPQRPERRHGEAAPSITDENGREQPPPDQTSGPAPSVNAGNGPEPPPPDRANGPAPIGNGENGRSDQGG
jgi:hypothetical protein